ncbi:BrnA antitoxin family protein [Candidatus Methylospira mobilis]|uniref:BrnA antitoxin family protein n=1 Tax=Candidatus Methylospira mobilis TaxID=1808979 RepID=UPI001D17B75A|nr:BrnA antitoxin family protein [Candidatus Methylospira mobilis]WNV04193.1 BrnA antitoxin family protein [Candidatus Methylospira mobilis]
MSELYLKCINNYELARHAGALSGLGRQKTQTRVSTTVRFDPEVLETCHATDLGWQTRMNDMLKDKRRESIRHKPR